MPLTLIATPIGHWQDISERCLQALKQAEVVIGEEPKRARKLLAQYGLRDKIENLYFLNEHSDAAEIHELIEFCQSKPVVYFSDAGTPSFCDPGFQLVKLCRKKKIPVISLPGPSSLSQILSLSSKKIENFDFVGFLAREKDARKKQWQEMQKQNRAMIFMDTPYRMQQSLQELKNYLPDREVLIGCDLTSEGEIVLEGRAKETLLQSLPKKADFLVLVYAK
tara:strand:- start:12397 stop:13062 length:666 start_codon:yes stop_codon:yes gene_type:complete